MLVLYTNKERSFILIQRPGARDGFDQVHVETLVGDVGLVEINLSATVQLEGGHESSHLGVGLDVEHDVFVVDVHGSVRLTLDGSGIGRGEHVAPVLLLDEEGRHVEDAGELVTGGLAPGSLGDADPVLETGVFGPSALGHEVVGELSAVADVLEGGDEHALAVLVSAVFLDDGVELSVGSLEDLEPVDVLEGDVRMGHVGMVHLGVRSVDGLSLSSEIDLVTNVDLSLVDVVVSGENIGKPATGGREDLGNIPDLLFSSQRASG